MQRNKNKTKLTVRTSRRERHGKTRLVRLAWVALAHMLVRAQCACTNGERNKFIEQQTTSYQYKNCAAHGAPQHTLETKSIEQIWLTVFPQFAPSGGQRVLLLIELSFCWIYWTSSPMLERRPNNKSVMRTNVLVLPTEYVIEIVEL